MARSKKKTCPECGALVPAGSTTCELCGSNVEEAAHADAGVDTPDAAPADGLFCNHCGWKNPAGSRFCAGCGDALQAAGEGEPARPGLPPEEPELAEPRSTSTDPSDVGKQVTLLVGGGVLIILALYIITLVSKQNVTTGGAEPTASLSAIAVLEDAGAEPPPAEVQSAADDIRQQMGQVPLDERRALQTQLVDLYYEAGLPDYAAVEARAVAEETGHPSDWRDAGDLFFHWMETANPMQRAEIAQLTIDAYERVLEHTPDNHDVRANLAWASQYDASDPMRAIDETNYILDRDENHLQAVFNRGYFLMRINRFDQAVEQFERVQEMGDADSPIVQQATAIIEMIQEQRSE